jgi:ferredoxin-NADP reductase
MSIRLLIASEVVEVAALSESVRRFRMAPLHRPSYPSFLGGEHVQVQLGDGLRRDFSLCGSPSERDFYEIAVLREEDGRGGSERFHSSVRVGEEVYVSYPQPGMLIDERAAHHVFVAGGIGITAILGLLRGFAGAAEAVVHYCVRHQADAVYLEELEQLGSRVILHVSTAGTRMDAEELIAGLPLGATVYHCGPESLMRSIDEAAAARAVPTRSETFATVPKRREILGAPFRAIMLAAGKTVEVGADETLLQSMLREGVPIEFSCEGGVCGSCVVEVQDGPIDHRDHCLSDSDRRLGMMTACVSRAAGDQLTVLL